MIKIYKTIFSLVDYTCLLGALCMQATAPVPQATRRLFATGPYTAEIMAVVTLHVTYSGSVKI
jgi:hypothetical protein